MRKENKDLVIPFIGLKNGVHQYEFEIDSEFFEQFDYSIIKKADFKVKVEFEKKINLFNLSFNLKGTVFANCDRCTEEMQIEAEGIQSLIVKFGETNYNETDEIRVIAPSEHELDLSGEIYEYIHLLLPTKIEHEVIEECNQEIIEKLEQLSTKQETGEVDPRWAALSNLKDKSE